MFWLVGQHRLHDVRVEFRDQTVESASIFPFFDRAGKTKALMLTSRENGDIHFVPYSKDLFKRRLFRPNRIDLTRADLRDRGQVQVQRLADVWHFDPWWELGGERYSNHPSVPELRATNIPGYKKPFSKLWFDRSLSQARAVEIHRGDETSLRRFSPALLEEAEYQRSQGSSPPREIGRKRSPGWRLRPFWDSATGR